MPLNKSEQEEIADSRLQRYSTLRPTVEALEKILYEVQPILDHGFIRVVDYMGDDSSIVQAARVSYGRGTRRLSDDRNLIRYLLRHAHSTPFEMAEIKLHVKLPIFVARQWIRHRTANVNEYSARYSILDKEFYLPNPKQLAAQSEINRQGRGEVLSDREAAQILQLLKQDADVAYTHYLEMLNLSDEGHKLAEDRIGIARELARMNLSLNFYTQWYWKCDLHNLMNFLKLRTDPHAQFEIRVYAEKILDIFRLWCPMAYDAFLEYRLHATMLSKSAVSALQRALRGETVTQETSGLGKREWDEFTTIFPLAQKKP